MAYRSDRAAGRLERGRRGWWYHAVAALTLLAYLIGAAGLVRTLWVRRQEARYERRGVAYGVENLVPGVALDPWGVNVALEQYEDEDSLDASLDLLTAAGFRWVRQRFPWSEIEPAPGEYRWQPWDRIVPACAGRGLRIVAVLDGSPDWARAPEDAANPLAPPRNPGHLASFARAFASRYGQWIDYYQIWDEPNIYPHWGERDVDPVGYLRLLRAARTQIRDVDPGATLVLAGLAPTTERGGRNLSELLFLQACYDAGGQGLFEVVATKPYGFWSGPEDRVVDPGVLNFSRVIALREEMVRRGDAGKPVWAVAWGWNALPEDWQGQPSPWGNDAAWKQHDRDERAIARARQEWPWLGLMCYAAWQPVAPPDDPVWGLALLDSLGKPRPLYYRLQALAHAPQVLYPGYHELAAPAADAPAVEIRFWGTRLDLASGGAWAVAEVDGRPLEQRSAPGGEPVAIVRGLDAEEHEVALRAVGPGAALTVIVSREEPPWLPLRVALTQGAIVALATLAVWRLLRPYPWGRWAAAVLATAQRLSPWAAFACAVGALVLLALAPGAVASVGALVVLAFFVAVRPDAGLMLAVFLTPLAPLEKWFGPLHFSFLEIVTLLTLGVRLAWEAVAILREGGPLWQRTLLRLRAGLEALDAIDVGVVLLLGASLASLGASENLRVSLRELRVVVLQAAFLYWLATRGPMDRGRLLHLADLLVLSGALLSLHGLYQYAFTDKVIVAEGVRRIRGIFGSPNNLALVLGRLWPLMLAVALRGPTDRRRLLYGLAAVPAAACLFLTYSRAAWLFGLPAALVMLGVLAGRRARVVALALLAAGLVALVPLAGTARLGSLFTFRGTTLLRVKLWEAAWEMARDHPVWGVGLDNFLYQYPRYIRPEALSEPNLSHPHNIVLDFWLRLGVPGLVSLGWLQWQFWQRGLALWRRRGDPALWALTIGLLAGMADTLAHGAVDASFFFVELAGLFALMMAFVRRMERLQPPAPGQH